MVVGSGADVLDKEAERFSKYVLADAKLRRLVLNEATALAALKKALAADQSLNNLLDDINAVPGAWERVKSRFSNAPEIKSLIANNIQAKRAELKKRVSATGLRGNAAKKETERRLKLSTARAGQILGSMQPSSVSIASGVRDIRVRGYVRGGVQVAGYRRSYRPYTEPENRLLRANIGRSLDEIHAVYLQSNFGYRSKDALKKQIRRLSNR